MSKPDYEEHEEVENEVLDETEKSDTVEHDDVDVEHHDDNSHDDDDDDAASEPDPTKPSQPPLQAEFIVEEVGDGSDDAFSARENDSDPSLGYQGARLQMMRNRFVDDDDLVVSSSVTEMVPEAPDLIVCPNPNCNSEEVRGHKFCSQCNARLPNLPVIEQKYNPGSIDGAARKYVDAVTKLQSEEWSVEEFNDFLNKGLERVQKHAENMAALSEDNVIGEWLPEAAELISDATQQWYRAVETMLVKVDDCHEDFDEEMAHYEELDDEELEERDPPLSLEDRVRMTDFNPEIEAIFESNNKMLEYLRILDDNTKSAAQVGGVSY